MSKSYTRPTRSRKVGGKVVTKAISSAEMKRTIAKARGISLEQVDKEYYKFRNKLRAYENFKRAQGDPVEEQSPLNVMYYQAKAQIRKGKRYKPSAQMRVIESFSAVSITKGRQLASDKNSRWFKKKEKELADSYLRDMKKFISAHEKAKQLRRDYRAGKLSGTGLVKALKEYSKRIGEKMTSIKKASKNATIPFGEVIGSPDVDVEIDFSEYYKNE